MTIKFLIQFLTRSFPDSYGLYTLPELLTIDIITVTEFNSVVVIVYRSRVYGQTKHYISLHMWSKRGVSCVLGSYVGHWSPGFSRFPSLFKI